MSPQTSGRFFPIPGNFQKEARRIREEKNSIKKKEEEERPTNKESDGISTRSNDSDSELPTQSKPAPEPARSDMSSIDSWLNMGKFMKWKYTNMDMIKNDIKSVEEEKFLRARDSKRLEMNLDKFYQNLN
ncbi:hypothetical protein O181_133070 [Austropuccinia psidii MF-1]|uniref:Uncharacterized protein n=1 Tax=Austropuccinia psidii MF-1 TaxID=1389203 RepID=A0A9Q3L412_9BASI|nr:hypothetical protein [Austropuccinia psidii MF-1]